MKDVPFVDAHIHFWELDRLNYAWLAPPYGDDGPNGSVEAIAANYAAADYLADMARWNVVGAVHVDAGADPKDAIAETAWLEGVADDSGLPTGIVAFAALQGADAERVLERQATSPRVRGIRQIVNWHHDARRTYSPVDLTISQAWQKGLSLLPRYELSFDLQCYPRQMTGLAMLLRAHEDLQVVINHVGMPVIADPDGRNEWVNGLNALATLPNVSIKLSGLGFIDRQWTYAGVAPFLSQAVDMFGPQRCMFASDCPTDKLFSPIDRYMEAYQRFASPFSEDEQRDMFGRNANRIYRLGLEI